MKVFYLFHSFKWYNIDKRGKIMNFEQQLLNKHILIIDDDKILNSSIRDILTAHGFSNLTSAYDIESSLDMIEKISSTFSFLDIMLPDGDGYTLAKHIRKKGDTPILFLTAKNNPEDEVAGFNAGGDDYVMKPFIPKILSIALWLCSGEAIN